MIRWGLIGLGSTVKRFMEGLAMTHDGTMVAFASRTPSKNEAFGLSYPSAKSYVKYEDLLEDENVDAVYITLRHADHFKWAKAALLKGKSVLCEKPATLSSSETKELSELSKASNLFFMEAMKTRFVPLTQTIRDALTEGLIGKPIRIETSFCYSIDYLPDHYLYDPIQGGILYDVGSYNLAMILDLIHSPVIALSLNSEMKYGVDVYDWVELSFETGETAVVEVAMDRNKPRLMTITGEKGTLTAEPFYRPQRVVIQPTGGEEIRYESVVDDFVWQIEESHRCIEQHLSESPRMTHQASIECIEIIERIRESFV